MPLYEYRCRKCGAQLEKIQKFSDPPLESCEKCGGKLERLLSTPAIHFKGSGWYVTDYARKSTPSRTASSESASTSKPNGSSASESKKVSETSKTSTEPKSSSD